MNTDELITHAKSRFDHALSKCILKEKYQAKLTFTYAGGLWRAGPELLVLLQAIPVNDDVVLLDLYENPIKINPAELQHLALGRWQEQMNAWLLEHEELSKHR
jgi:hypothetical protein